LSSAATRPSRAPRPLASADGPPRVQAATATSTVKPIISSDSSSPRSSCVAITCSMPGRSSFRDFPLIRATHTVTSEISVSSSAGHRVAQRCLGSTANTITRSEASGTNTTAAWTTSGCSGSPMNSMP
jgi:hypothetical protein